MTTDITLNEEPTDPVRLIIRNLAILLGLFVLYAIAFQVTDISGARLRSPERQEQVTGVLRFLADPDLSDPDVVDKVAGVDEESLTLTQISRDTVRLITETVFMALVATTIGTVLAVPVSFLAARNLMTVVTMPLAAIMLAIVAVPIGAASVWWVTSRTLSVAASLSTQSTAGVLALAAVAVVIWLLSTRGPSLIAEERRPITQTFVAYGRVLLMLLLGLFGIGLAASYGEQTGSWLTTQLGQAGILSVFAFLGNFLQVLSDAVGLLLAPVMAILGAIVAASVGSRYGQETVLRVSGAPARLMTALFTAGGTAVLIYGIGASMDWLYQFDDPSLWKEIPAGIGAVVAAALSLLLPPRRSFGIGTILYFISRGILNILRSIEPLIMAVVFVVWVGLGPFAGVMALTLHTIAALGKLFSEQIEGISEGPIEAVIATGANRLQMIVFAVIPQIIPPYIAYTLYRWDINVRMSTIIGFVGGGGIGFLLSQSTRLLRYRDASVMMLSIAIVVSLLDYLSSRIRSRII